MIHSPSANLPSLQVSDALHGFVLTNEAGERVFGAARGPGDKPGADPGGPAQKGVGWGWMVNGW